MNKRSRGFTLIELSIVLVVIGLLAGGVLVGQDLIRAAEVRAQISQIEKFNTAVNTFRGKYQAIPGDMNVAAATQFGFAVGANCSGSQGARDGNGLIDGGIQPWPLGQAEFETALFWQDISSIHLIDGSYPNGGISVGCVDPGYTVASTVIGEYIPPAKIGRGNYVYVYETGGSNWYGLVAVTSISATGGVLSNQTIPAIQAYNMDKKMDDGLPATGNVQATYISNNGTNVLSAPNGTSDTSSTCYNTTSNAYSIDYNGGSGPNCALSFAFQ